MKCENSESENIRKTEILQEILRHIPNEVVYCFHNNLTYFSSEKIVMFIDVSGFTAITEMYSMFARSGIDDLTIELNKYFSMIIDHIADNSGEVIKFAGDAILSSWPMEGVLQALKCGIDIQRTCSSYTVVNSTNSDKSQNFNSTNFEKSANKSTELNVRIVIVCGNADFIIIKTKHFNHFVLIGHVIDELKAIEAMSEIKTVLMSQKFWKIIPEEFRQLFDKSILFGNDMCIKIRNDKDCVACYKPNVIKREELVDLYTQTDLIAVLSKFVITPVLEKIANLEPLKYASEMIHLSICFIKVEMKPDLSSKLNKSLINEISDYIDTISHTYDGLLSKVIGFDKGLSFLCLFGLGEMENTCVGALDAAEIIECWLSEMNEFVHRSSVGVASGLTYCGVVGNHVRHEYTSIGRKVNLSARLMCYYPGVVSCDEETMINSRLPTDCFKKLPIVSMKGIKENVIAFKFRKTDISKIDFMQKEINFDNNKGGIGLFGRRIELMIVCSKITSLMNSERKEDKYALVFKGEDGSGRSSILHYIFSVLKVGNIEIEVLLIKCIPRRDRVNSLGYAGLITILGKMLHLESMGLEQRKKLYEQIKEVNTVSTAANLIIREWFEIQKTLKTKEMILDHLTGDKEFIEIIDIVLKYLKPRKYIILIDDLHHMDEESLELIVRISQPPNCIMIGTIRPNNKLMQIFTSGGIEFKTILSIKELHMHSLICKIFNVQSIERGLLKVLYQRTRGMPGLCLEAVVELRRNSSVDIRSIPSMKIIKAEKILSVASKRNLLVDLFLERGQYPLYDVPEPLRDLYCAKGDPNELDMPTSIEAAFMRQYNRLDAFQKSLLSNCSVLGPTFSRMYLFGTCKGNRTKKSFYEAIRILFENQMLKCAHDNENLSSARIICMCSNNPSKLSLLCKTYQFYHESIRMIVLASMTRQTIQYRRINAINWLERQLPNNLSPGAAWNLCAIENGPEIILSESYPSQSSFCKPSFIEVLNIMRIKSCEQLILMKDKFTIKAKHKPTKSKWNIVRHSILDGKLDCNMKRITSCCILMNSGKTINIKTTDIFDQWLIVDESNRLDCYTLGKFLTNKSKLNENISFDTRAHTTNLNDEKLFTMNNNRSYCNCITQLQVILEELIMHSTQICDYIRLIYYSLQLALIRINTGMTISAKNTLDNAEKHIHQRIPSLLKSLHYFVKASFELSLSNNCHGSIIYIQKALTFISDDKVSWPGSKDYTCCICKTISYIQMAKSIYTLMYKTACTDNDLKDKTQISANATSSIEYLSNTLIRHDNIQTILVLTKQYYKDSLNQSNKYEHNPQFQLMISYLKRTLRIVDLENLDSISAIIKSCLGYIMLEWAINLSQALDDICSAFDIFTVNNLIDHMALTIPYICLISVFVDKLDIIPIKLNIFKETLRNYHLFETDIRKSLYIALYSSLLIDFNETYIIDKNIQYDLELVSNHLKILNEEINLGLRLKFRPLNILYCMASVCRAYCIRNDVENAINFLKLSFHIFSSDCSRLSMLDPLTQRTILVLCECQLLLKKHLDNKKENSSFITMKLISSIACIDNISVNFPMYCMLNACKCHELQTNCLPDKQTKWWIKKGINAATKLRSNAEIKRIQMFILKFGLDL